jgi:SAM-dependent methyltransferase
VSADELRRCGICGRDARLRFRGATTQAGSEAFAPSSHEVGAHGDLYRCNSCGTVQQGDLPTAAELRVLYEDVRDARYLEEEGGRRRTARRLLALAGEYGAPGRLLDVGAGHGLLMDEARRLGWEPVGLEPSRDAREYARERLGLEVLPEGFDDAELPEGSFDSVFMVDVLEHMLDPASAIRRAARLLRPGGVLCVVTPDPASPTARAFGRRWWGLLPTHTFLLPRMTLRELLAASELVPCEDLPLRRDFSPGYWLDGLAGRGAAAGAVARVAGALLRSRRIIGATLFDERVIVSRRVDSVTPADPRCVERGLSKRVTVVLPAYRATRTLPAVAAELPVDAADRALVVDDASPDETSEVALREGFEVLTLPANRGYGGTQKSCYVRALGGGADVIVMVHADNQYDPALVPDIVRPLLEGRADMTIGSRLLEDASIIGGMPRWKWLGNKFLTAIENRAFGREFSEYHTGYRAFSAELLRSISFLRNSDGFVFDQQIFAQVVDAGARVEEVAIPTRYFLEASSVSFSDSVVYGLGTLRTLARYRLHRLGSRWTLIEPPAVELPARGPSRDEPVAAAAGRREPPPPPEQ